MDPLERQRRRARDFGTDEEQVANALDTFPNLTPTSTAPAEATKAKWAALTAGQNVPLLHERIEPDELRD